MSRSVLCSLLGFAIAALLAAASCTPGADTEAPDLTASQTPVPSALPNIQGMTARILTQGDALSNDVELLVAFPVSLNETPGDWVDRVRFYLDTSPPNNGGNGGGQACVYQPEDNVWAAIWEDVSPGERTFYAELVGTDDAPFDTPVVAEMTLTVPGENSGEPAVQRLSAGYLVNPPVPSADIQLNPEVINFEIIDAIGDEPAPGEGHERGDLHRDLGTVCRLKRGYRGRLQRVGTAGEQR